MPGIGGPPLPPPMPGMGGPRGPPALPGMPGGLGLPAAPAGPTKPKIKPNVAMRGLFWTKVPEKQLGSTVWGSISDEKVVLNVAELEDTFAKAEKVPVKASAADGKPSKKAEVKLLDGKRQQNAGIVISRVRVSNDELKAAVLAVDEVVLTEERCSMLAELTPTPDETQLLSAYDGDIKELGAVDRFFIEVSSMPRFKGRMLSMMLKYSFKEKVNTLRETISLLLTATREVRASQPLRRVLEVALAVGNYVNGSTPRGQYFGFKLDTLAKLGTVKGTDNKTTLTHFVVATIASTTPELLALSSSLSHVEAASKFGLAQIGADFAAVKKAVGELVKEVLFILRREKKAGVTTTFNAASPFRSCRSILPRQPKQVTFFTKR
jgi:diaphanous 1